MILTQTGGHIDRVLRMPNTPSGNPRWCIFLAHGPKVATKPDTAMAYRITGNETGPVLLTLEGGQIVDLDLIGANA